MSEVEAYFLCVATMLLGGLALNDILYRVQHAAMRVMWAYCRRKISREMEPDAAQRFIVEMEDDLAKKHPLAFGVSR